MELILNLNSSWLYCLLLLSFACFGLLWLVLACFGCFGCLRFPFHCYSGFYRFYMGGVPRLHGGPHVKSIVYQLFTWGKGFWPLLSALRALFGRSWASFSEFLTLLRLLLALLGAFWVLLGCFGGALGRFFRILETS